MGVVVGVGVGVAFFEDVELLLLAGVLKVGAGGAHGQATRGDNDDTVRRLPVIGHQRVARARRGLQPAQQHRRQVLPVHK